MDQPRSSIHGIFQARVLEWVAISFSNSRDFFEKLKKKKKRSEYNTVEVQN